MLVSQAQDHGSVVFDEPKSGVVRVGWLRHPCWPSRQGRECSPREDPTVPDDKGRTSGWKGRIAGRRHAGVGWTLIDGTAAVAVRRDGVGLFAWSCALASALFRRFVLLRPMFCSWTQSPPGVRRDG